MTCSLLNVLAQIAEHPGKWRCVHPLFRDDPARSHSPVFSNWLQTNSHRHEAREIMVALTGNTFYGVGHDVIKCRPGSVFFFESGHQHQVGYPPFAPICDHLWISIISYHVGAKIDNVRYGKIANSKLIRYFKSNSEIGIWLDRFWPKERPPEFPLDVYRARLLNALSILMTDIIQSALLPPRADRHAAQLRQTVQVIQDHIWETGGKDATLDNLSRIAGYSKYHFLRLFTKNTGQTVHAFVNMARANMYQKLIKAHTSKKQIADQLGFSSQAAFSRWLRQNIL